MTRRFFIAGNWKMNKGPGEAEELARELKNIVADNPGPDVAVAPPTLSIPEVVGRLKGTGVKVAAQNLHWEKKGAYTGEVSAEMIRAAGCSHVLIGHSERRQYFGETDATVNKKLFAAFRAGLDPIVCVGETLAQRDAGEAEAVVRTQLEGGLAGVQEADSARITIAYEPVWAIGTGRTATPEQAQEMHRFIRGWLQDRFGKGAAAAMRIQYGGSVTPSNATLLLSCEDIDGALVGGASLDASNFTAIVAAAVKVSRAASAS